MLRVVSLRNTSGGVFVAGIHLSIGMLLTSICTDAARCQWQHLCRRLARRLRDIFKPACPSSRKSTFCENFFRHSTVSSHL